MSEIDPPKLVVQVLPSPSGRRYVTPVYAHLASGAFKAVRDERGAVPGPPFHVAFPEIRCSTSGEQQPASRFGFVGYIEVASDCVLPAGAFGSTTAAPSGTILCTPKSTTFCREDRLCVNATTSSVPIVSIGDAHLPRTAIDANTKAFFAFSSFQHVCDVAALDSTFKAAHARSAHVLTSDRKQGRQCTSVVATRQYCASLGRFALLCNPPVDAPGLGAYITVVSGGSRTERGTTRPYRLTLACASDRTRQRQVTLWPSDAETALGSDDLEAQLTSEPMLLLVSGTPPDARGRVDFVVRALTPLLAQTEPTVSEEIVTASPDASASPQSTLARVEAAIGRPVNRWPAHYASAARAPCLGFKAETHGSGTSRLGLTLFCLHNRVPPSLYIEWLRERGCIKTDAWSEIKHAMTKLSRGEALGSTWDLCERRTMTAVLPQASHANIPAALVVLAAHTRDGGAHGSAARPPPPPGCAVYYTRLYPFDAVARLLHRPSVSSPFPLRELAIDRCVLRSRPVLSLGKWQSTARFGHGAASLHVGPAYAADTQVARLDDCALGTELVLELDELPTGIEESARWTWMRHDTEVTLHVLREWFGLGDVFGFASGNRGPHFWLLDAAVLQQTKAERAAFFERLSRPCEHEGWSDLAERYLLPFYHSTVTTNGAAAPSDVELARLAYPSFDRAVATDPAHLHRLPFSVNEKTGRVAVPFVLAPPFEGLPHAMEDMPRVDDPELQRKLEAPLALLHAAAVEVGGVGATIADVPPLADAPWSQRGARKRKERSSDGSTADLPVSDLRVDVAATVAWLAALRAPAAAGDSADLSTAITDECVRSVAERSQFKGKDWRARLRSEANTVEKLVTALKLRDVPQGECVLLKGETYTNGDGRTLTHYPQLDEAQYVARLAKESRHAITADAYAEVDLAAAHLAGAWGACERRFGEADAARRCPSLRLAATDKRSARALVVSQSGAGWTTERAKRAIAAALNQETGDGVRRCAFLEALVAERPHMAEALRDHPAIAGAPLESIRRRCEGHPKPAVRELSLMLQTLEAAIVRCAVGTLGEHGFETGAFIADGLLVRPLRGNAELNRALTAVSRAVREALGVSVVMECEHSIRQ